MKIQLKHPEGKVAVTMDTAKYELLKETILNILKNGQMLPHKEIVSAVNEHLKRANIKFDGSVNWHLEWVKLDMEAANLIKRIEGTPVKYLLNNEF